MCEFFEEMGFVVDELVFFGLIWVNFGNYINCVYYFFVFGCF